MRSAQKVESSVFRLISLGFILCALVLLCASCASWRQLGETRAEARRRHKRLAAINRRELVADIDRVLLYDKPSKLADKRIP